MPSSPDFRLMFCKQDAQLNQGAACDQRLISHFNSRTNHRIEHPCGHAAGRPVGKPHIDHAPLAASRAESLIVLPEERMKWIEDFRKQTNTRIVERAS